MPTQVESRLPLDRLTAGQARCVRISSVRGEASVGGKCTLTAAEGLPTRITALLIEGRAWIEDSTARNVERASSRDAATSV